MSPISAPAPEPRRAASTKVAALITDNVTIEGGITGDGELQVDGAVRGDVRVTRVNVGETGQVEGSIQAESVEIRGRVVGSVSARQVRLYGTAHVDGDISHEQLAMEPGAFFQGRSLRLQRAPEAASRPAVAAATPAAVPSPAPAAKPANGSSGTTTGPTAAPAP